MSFEDYMRDIARVPLLTCDEEIILGTQVQEMMRLLRENQIADQVSDANLAESLKALDPHSRRIARKGLKARNRMISANMRLVVTIAKKSQARQVHMTLQDLMQEGAIGLARAAEKFEPSRGYKFSTYAYWWIRQAITRAIESQEGAIKVPAHIQRTIKQAKEAKARLSAELMREPSFAEIAEAINEESPEKIQTAVALNPVIISFDLKPSGGRTNLRDACSLADIVNADIESEIRESEDTCEKISFVLMTINALPESEQQIIKQRYGIDADQL
ncbi:MAG: sigma-70 family RNA polymerase sigma factor, partial [Pirellulaceae bacterium]